MGTVADSIIANTLNSVRTSYNNRIKEEQKRRALAQKEFVSVESRKQKLLDDPSLLDREVTKTVSDILPGIKKPNFRKYSDKITAIEESVPKNHPLKGFTS
jgi:hypothetical protein